MNAIVPHQPSPLSPRNFSELIEFAERAARSTMVPKDYINRPENILIAVQMGAELGLAPMQALQNISVVNGRPAVWGDAMPALCRQSAVCDDIIETIEGEGDKMVAICVAKRVGKKPVEQRFSVDNAKKAGLWGKAGTWTQYPQRMLQMRARGFALRDAFPDVLRGLISVEEAADIPAPAFTGPTVEHEAAPDLRAEINAETPMRPPAAQTQAVTRAPRRTEPANGNGQRTDEQWRLWLDKLRAAVAVVHTLAEVEEIGDRETVGTALGTGPAFVKREISTILADGYERFVKPPPEADAADEPELPEVAGERYGAA